MKTLHSLRFDTASLLALTAAAVALQTGCGGAAEPVDEQVESAEDALTRAQCRGAVGEADPRCRIEGVVESMFVGEMDPFVVGDACVTFVRSGAKRYGLVRAPEACPDPDRYSRGDIKVSFSKGAIDLASRGRSRVLKEYDSGATYYELSGPLRESTSSALAAFDALSAEKKVAFLYDVAPDRSWASLRRGFTKAPIRIVDTQTGDALRAALAAYRDIASFAYANGGGQPGVFAIQKDGVTYAYSIEASGRSYGNWGSLAIHDRAWAELATFGYSD
ncbi:MAG: hypothetical protein JST00_08370 [Deltaproteobacteria bacterium]|nr:hypothetical protein [Deltaproteobacteria bacterium]